MLKETDMSQSKFQLNDFLRSFRNGGPRYLIPCYKEFEPCHVWSDEETSSSATTVAMFSVSCFARDH